MVRGLAAIAPSVLLLLALDARADVPVDVVFTTPATDDQDDMALWLHPDDPGKSVVIASDKANGNVVVYGLDGASHQTVVLDKPGNIDLRHDVPWGDACADLVVINERVDAVLVVLRVDRDTGELSRIDPGDLAIGGNYGLGLHLSAEGRLSAFTGPEGPTTIQRFDLAPAPDGSATIAATDWSYTASQIEGMVADDAAGRLFLGEEDVGIWSIAVDDASDVVMVAAVDDASGLTADVEGLTIYHRGQGGYLIASSQGASKYTVLDLLPPHAPVGEFRITGVGETDGIDVVNVALGDAFPEGLFTAHNGADCCPVVGVSWRSIADDLGLEVDVDGWSPRRGCMLDGGDTGGVDGGGSGGAASSGAGDDTEGGSGATTAADGPDGGPASTGPDAPGSETGVGVTQGDGSGCGCRSEPPRPAALLLVVVALLRRRRANERGEKSSAPAPGPVDTCTPDLM